MLIEPFFSCVSDFRTDLGEVNSLWPWYRSSDAAFSSGSSWITADGGCGSEAADDFLLTDCSLGRCVRGDTIVVAESEAVGLSDDLDGGSREPRETGRRALTGRVAGTKADFRGVCSKLSGRDLPELVSEAADDATCCCDTTLDVGDNGARGETGPLRMLLRWRSTIAEPCRVEKDGMLLLVLLCCWAVCGACEFAVRAGASLGAGSS